MFVLEPFLQLLFNFFFSYPSGTEKLALAKEIVSLFPSLRIQVPGGGGGGGRTKKHICPCFTPSWIALAESARETVSLPWFVMLSTRFISLEQETLLHSRYMIWLIFT